MKNKILVTGGAGFIGSEFVRQGVKKGYDIIVVDKLTYSGDLTRLKEVKNKFKFYKIDICDKDRIEAVIRNEKIKSIINFAAETHVDRSIVCNDAFIKTNVLGVQNLIDASVRNSIEKFYHISTDEVYGESKVGYFSEKSQISPNNPYSATKAAGEFLIKAAARTHKLQALIIRPSNTYGPWQYPEKFIPVIISKILHNENIPVYGKGKQIREWLYVSDCVDGIFSVINKGKVGEVYNIGSNFEKTNLELVKIILKQMKSPEKLIKFVSDRPGHDFRYGVDCTKIKKELGWSPKIDFNIGITQTLDWYQKNLAWIKSHLKKD